MTKLIRVLILSVSILLSQHFVMASSWLEGFWKSESPLAIIEIESIGSGIKVKRTDSNDWHRYNRINDKLYKDSRGNSYYIFSDNEIVATYYTFEKSGNSDWKVVSFSHTGNKDRYTTLRMGSAFQIVSLYTIKTSY